MSGDLCPLAVRTGSCPSSDIFLDAWTHKPGRDKMLSGANARMGKRVQ